MKTLNKFLIAILICVIIFAFIRFIIAVVTPTCYYEEEGAQYETRVFNGLVDHIYRTKERITVVTSSSARVIRVVYGNNQRNEYSTTNLFVQRNKQINER